VVDVSNPASPQELGAFDTPGFALGVAISGHYAYVADYEAGLRVVDLHDPAHLQELGFCDTPDFAIGVAIDAGFAYVAAGLAGLRVIEVSHPELPVELGCYDTGVNQSANGVEISGGLAFVSASYGGLFVLDVSNPVSPQLEGHCLASARDIDLSGDMAYVIRLNPMGPETYLSAIDVSDPTNPLEVGSCFTWYARDVAVTGGIALVAEEHYGLSAYDVTNPADFHVLGGYTTTASIKNMAVAGSTAYLATGARELRVLDLQELASPREIGSYFMGYEVHDVVTNGNLALVAAGDAGLRVLDISNPDSLLELGFYEAPDWAAGVAVAGNTAYVTDGSDGLSVIDLSDPAHPQGLGYCDIPISYFDVAVADGTAYVACRGLRVIDVANPSSPHEVSFYPAGNCKGVAVDGSMVYLAEHNWQSNGYLRVIDVSQPQNPQELGHIESWDGFSKVTAFDGMAYGAAYEAGLRVVDVRDPANLLESGHYSTSCIAFCVASIGDTVLVGTSDGLLAIRYDGDAAVDPPTNADPATIALEQNTPNPFNPTTVIEYSLPTPQSVTLRVFDLAGRLVRELANGPRAAGAHQVVFDGRGLASGVYIYELRAGQTSTSRKMLLIQ
jgi:hypothetical protein